MFTPTYQRFDFFSKLCGNTDRNGLLTIAATAL